MAYETEVLATFIAEGQYQKLYEIVGRLSGLLPVTAEKHGEYILVAFGPDLGQAQALIGDPTWTTQEPVNLPLRYCWSSWQLGRARDRFRALLVFDKLALAIVKVKHAT